MKVNFNVKTRYPKKIKRRQTPHPKNKRYTRKISMCK